MYIFQLATIADATVVGGADVVFSNNGPTFGGVTHTAGTTVMTVPSAGTYSVEYCISFTAGVGATMAIAVNGVVDPSTSVTFLTATGTVCGQAMLQLTAGDILTLRDNSATPFTLALAPSVSAQLIVNQVS
jgi:hypothetical protein